MTDIARLTQGVRWLTFDCYGTLIDWESGILAAVRPVLSKHVVQATDAEILGQYAAQERESESGRYSRYRDVLRCVMDGLGQHFKIPLETWEYSALVDSLADWPVWPDTPGALAALQRRFKVAVISNIDDDLFAATAAKLGVKLDGLITAQQCRSYKPSLNNFRVAMEKLSAGPVEILHVAESLYHDIAPARTLGIRSVWVNRRRGGISASGTASATPDLEVGSLAELVEALSSLPPRPRH